MQPLASAEFAANVSAATANNTAGFFMALKSLCDATDAARLDNRAGAIGFRLADQTSRRPRARGDPYAVSPMLLVIGVELQCRIIDARGYGSPEFTNEVQ